MTCSFLKSGVYPVYEKGSLFIKTYLMPKSHKFWSFCRAWWKIPQSKWSDRVFAFLSSFFFFFSSFNNNINNKTLSEKMSKINGRDKKTYTNKKVVQHLNQRICVWFLFLAITSFSSRNNKPVDPQRQQTVIVDVW